MRIKLRLLRSRRSSSDIEPLLELLLELPRVEEVFPIPAVATSGLNRHERRGPRLLLLLLLRITPRGPANRSTPGRRGMARGRRRLLRISSTVILLLLPHSFGP